MKHFILITLVALFISCDKPNDCVVVDYTFKDYYGPGVDDYDLVTLEIEDCL